MISSLDLLLLLLPAGTGTGRGERASSIEFLEPTKPIMKPIVGGDLEIYHIRFSRYKSQEIGVVNCKGVVKESSDQD